MKTISVLFALALVTASVESHAQGIEEICSERATQAVIHKRYFVSNPESFQFSLDRLAKASIPENVKKIIREDLYFIYNRKEVSDSLMYDLVLTRCFKQMK